MKKYAYLHCSYVKLTHTLGFGAKIITPPGKAVKMLATLIE